jgi:DNA polymerase III delta prime subunit
VTLEDVVSHKDIINTSKLFARSIDPTDMAISVERFIEKNRLPHLLFYGPPGTGKTSTILAVARRIYGTDYRKQILEVCPSSSTGGNNSDQIRFSSTRLTNVALMLFGSKSNNLLKRELCSRKGSS